jgi:hypothetical protein
MRNLEKCLECLQRFNVEWQGKSSQKGISFLTYFISISRNVKIKILTD